MSIHTSLYLKLCRFTITCQLQNAGFNFFLNRKPRDLQKPNENKILFELEIEKKNQKLLHSNLNEWI